MNELIEHLNWQLLFIPAAVGLLVALIWRGMLTQQTLDLGPTRDMGLTPAEAVTGVVLGVLPTLVSVLPLGIGAEAGALLWLVSLTLLFVVFGMRVSTVEAGFRKIGLVARHPMRDLKFALIATPIAIVLASGTSILFMIVGQLIGSPAPLDIGAGHQTLLILKQSNDVRQIVGIIIGAAIVAPILEEFCYRAVMQTSLLGWLGTDRRWRAIVLTAVIFGLVHFSAVTTWHVLPALIVLGLVFGFVYERTGSLLCCTLVHAGFNGFNLALTLIERVL